MLRFFFISSLRINLSKLLPNIKRIINAPLVEKTMFLEAACYLTSASLLIRFVPFRHVARLIGQPMRESAYELSEQKATIASIISQAIRRANGRLPWEHKCLVQAIAAKWMLTRRGVSNTVYFGVKNKTEEELFSAHAWVRSGRTIVTGAKGAGEFSIIATFSQVR